MAAGFSMDIELMGYEKWFSGVELHHERRVKESQVAHQRVCIFLIYTQCSCMSVCE